MGQLPRAFLIVAILAAIPAATPDGVVCTEGGGYELCTPKEVVDAGGGGGGGGPDLSDEVQDLEDDVAALNFLTQDITAGTPPGAWGNASSAAVAGIALFTSFPSCAAARGATYAVSITSGVGGKYHAVRLPASTERGHVRIHITGADAAEVYNEVLSGHYLRCNSTDGKQAYYVEGEAGQGAFTSSVTGVAMQTNTGAHLGSSSYSGTPTKVQDWAIKGSSTAIPVRGVPDPTGHNPGDVLTLATPPNFDWAPPTGGGGGGGGGSGSGFELVATIASKTTADADADLKFTFTPGVQAGDAYAVTMEGIQGQTPIVSRVFTFPAAATGELSGTRQLTCEAGKVCPSVVTLRGTSQVGYMIGGTNGLTAIINSMSARAGGPVKLWRAGGGGGGGGHPFSSATPKVESGSGSPGASEDVSRGDHAHPVNPTVGTNTRAIASLANTVNRPMGVALANGQVNTLRNCTGSGSSRHCTTEWEAPAAFQYSITASDVAATSAPGTATAVSRGDHVHGRGGGGGGAALSDAVPKVDAGSGAAGSGTKASRDDHVHPASGGGADSIYLPIDVTVYPARVADGGPTYPEDNGPVNFARKTANCPDGLDSCLRVSVPAEGASATSASGVIVEIERNNIGRVPSEYLVRTRGAVVLYGFADAGIAGQALYWAPGDFRPSTGEPRDCGSNSRCYGFFTLDGDTTDAVEVGYLLRSDVLPTVQYAHRLAWVDFTPTRTQTLAAKTLPELIADFIAQSQSDLPAAALGATARPGTSQEGSRADHVHPLPAADQAALDELERLSKRTFDIAESVHTATWATNTDPADATVGNFSSSSGACRLGNSPITPPSIAWQTAMVGIHAIPQKISTGAALVRLRQDTAAADPTLWRIRLVLEGVTVGYEHLQDFDAMRRDATYDYYCIGLVNVGVNGVTSGVLIGGSVELQRLDISAGDPRGDSTFRGDPLIVQQWAKDTTTLIPQSKLPGSAAGAHPFETANPQAIGTAAPGTSLKVSRGDHVHPTTGVLTTARLPDASNDKPVALARDAAVGSSSKVALADHVHPLAGTDVVTWSQASVSTLTGGGASGGVECDGATNAPTAAACKAIRDNVIAGNYKFVGVRLARFDDNSEGEPIHVSGCTLFPGVPGSVLTGTVAWETACTANSGKNSANTFNQYDVFVKFGTTANYIQVRTPNYNSYGVNNVALTLIGVR